MNSLLLPEIKSWLNPEVNNLKVDGTTTLVGPLITAGNINITNSAPVVQLNASPAGEARVIVSSGNGNITIGENSDGSGFIQNYGTGALSLITSGPGNLNLIANSGGFIDLIGSNYPAGPYILGLNASNQIYNAGPVSSQGRVTQTSSPTTTVTYNGSTCIITTVSLTNLPGAITAFTLLNSSITTTSVVLATMSSYTGTTGYPIVLTGGLNTAGQINILVNNYHASAQLNGVITISISVQ